jgi:hypothetical protein
MRKNYFKFKISIIFLVIACSSFLYANEFLVNTYMANNQYNSGIDINDNGYFVIAWMNNGFPGGSGNDICVRRFDSNGNPLGIEFLANYYVNGEQENPQVIMEDDNSFFVVWFTNSLPGGNSQDICMRKFDSNGNPLGPEYLVNSPYGEQRVHSVDRDANGNFVVTWQGSIGASSGFDIYARRFDCNGNPLGNEFMVNPSTNYGYEQGPDVGMCDDGSFIITWTDQNYPGGNNDEIVARRYDSNGNPLGAEFKVNQYINGPQTISRIHVYSDGSFVIAWSSGEYPGGNNWDVCARLFDNNGNPKGYEFLLNTNIQGEQRYPNIDMDKDGNFILYWYDLTNPNGSGSDALVRRFNSDGSPFDSQEFIINSNIEGYQTRDDIAMINPLKFIAVYQDQNYPGGNQRDLVANYYNEETPTPTATPTCSPSSIALESFSAKAIDDNVILTWKTGTEIDNLGFYLIKSENIGSGYTILNNQIIPARGNNYSGYSYEYIDKSIKAGHFYFYWLADVDVFGKYEIHGPIKIITKPEAITETICLR